jgi:parvulin-like peptidyl-prolyl isomerase
VINRISPARVLASFLSLVVGTALTVATFAAPAAPSSKKTPRSTAARPPAARPADVIGVIDGIPLRQSEWDRLEGPYFQEVEARAGRKLTEDENRQLKKNLLEELIRERLWVADAHRRGMTVPGDAVDNRMKASAFFKVNGKVDEGKFLAYKQSPGSNYAMLRSQVEMGILLEDYQRWMERRFGPREAEVKKAYQERTAQATVRYFVLGAEAMSSEPEANAKQIRAYYESHQSEFQSADSAHVQYVRVAFEAATSDSAKEAVAQGALKSANDLLGAIQSGAPVETAAKVYGGLHDTGWFRTSDPIRGLGRSEALLEAIRNATPGSWLKTPLKVGNNFLVVRLVERKPSRVQSFREVAPTAKRKADALVREGLADSLGREDLRLHPETYAVPRLRGTIVVRAGTEIDSVAPPTEKEVDKELDKRRKAAKVKKSDRAWADSVRATLPAEIRRQRRDQAVQRAFKETIDRLRKKEPGMIVANEMGGVAEMFDLYRGQPIEAPMLVEGAFLDSLYMLRPGTVVGPRVSLDSVFVVRVDEIDPSFVPPYEAVRQAASSNATKVRTWALENEAKSYYEAHLEDFKRKPEWVFDYLYFRKSHPDSVAVPESAIDAYYRGHPLEFTAPASATPRIILFQYRPGDGPDAREKARLRAVAARERIVKGEDFAAVAKEVSDDRQSGEQGGLIGTMVRSSLIKELADVIFSIPIGEVSDVVEAKTAFHLIKVDARTEEKLRSLDESRAEIHTVLGEPIADSLAFSAASRMASAVAAGASFDSLARVNGGAIRSGPTQAGEDLPGIGPFEDVQTVIGALADGGTTPEPVTVGPGYLVARRFQEVAPAPAPFEEVKERAIYEYQLSRRRANADSVDQEIRQALAKGADVEALFERFGGMRTSKPFSRYGPIQEFVRDASVARDSTLLERVFSSRPGKVLPPIKSSLGTIYMVVESVAAPPASEFARRRDEVWREIVDQRIEAWTARLRGNAKVTLYKKELQSLLASR